MLSRFIFSLLLIWSTVVQAELRLSPPFTDHMVLQRDMPVSVWGVADAGADVSVMFADQTVSTTADADGAWRCTLAAMKGAATGADLIVKAGTDTVTLSDVVVGEVWICSGQSNMQFGASSVGALKDLSADGLRCLEVKRTTAFTEQAAVQGEWQVAGPSSAVAFGFAHHLAKYTEGVPVGIILSAWGSTSIEAWMPRDMTEELPLFAQIMAEWDADTAAQAKVRAALEKDKWERGDDVFMRRQSSIVYNAMMAPLVSYACRGLIWYQGERNARYMSGMPETPWYHRVSSIEDYDETLKAWIQRYRKGWGRDDMRFYMVMLPGFGSVLSTSSEKDQLHPEAHTWAWMRESQMAALDLPHTAVANTIDLGDVKNIHPRDKAPIGERLARLAAKDTLGVSISDRGPVFDKVEKQGGKLIVYYQHAEGLKTINGEAPQGFWVYDSNVKKWFPAQAEIAGDTVQLTSPLCPDPEHVRYAWAGKPEVNLVNGAGLPAYPFRTDDFDPLADGR